MATLTSLLARDGVVPLDVIEHALQRQVLEGGEIDTAVLELTSVAENVLASYRAASYGLPPVSRQELERADATLAAALPKALALEHGVVVIARDDKTLVLAAVWPLRAAAIEQIAQATGLTPSLRIGTELRTHAALARCYGEVLPRRLARLCERLDSESPGATLDVRPPAQPSEPPWRERISTPRPPRLPSQVHGEEGEAGKAAEPPAQDDASVSARRKQRADDEDVLPPPVRVVQVVRLGGSLRPSETRSVAGTRSNPKQEAKGPVLPSFPSLPPRPFNPLRVGRISAAPRGPLTQSQAMELLGRAQDRDRVLDAFFSFARQYFACAVLFALREERLLGLEASGLPELDVRALDLSVPRTGSIQATVLERGARVLDLTATPADLALAEALSRTHAQPCAVIPIAIRQRIVAVLYGDRGGEALQLEELTPLLQTLPTVSTAFERIIQQHKSQAIAARDQAHPSLAPRGGSRAPRPPARPQTSVGAGPTHARTAQNMPSQERSSTEVAPTPVVPKAPRVPAELAAPAPDDELMNNATQVLPAVRPSPRPPARPSQRPIGTYSVRSHEQDTTRPTRPPSKFPPAAGPDNSAAQAGGSDRPPPRTLSHAPPGAGAYSGGAATERAGISERPPARAPAAQPAPAPSNTSAVGPEFANRDPRRQTVPRRKHKTDPRRDSAEVSATAKPNADVVSIPKSVRDSLRPPAVPVEARAEPPSIVVDFGMDALRLIDELIRIGPDEDGRVLSQLLRLGDTALPILARRFPGPMWFDRHRPRKRLPLGREISAIARALHAFADKAVPHVAELLESKQADARFAATLLCSDLVRPALLWPLYKRLFDPDGQVRLITLETLPAYRNVQGFDEVLKSLRQRTQDELETLQSRLSALEALGALRDPGSVEVLMRLSEHQSRQLSVPAHRSLIAITGQDFDGERKWRAWLDKNKGRHRVEWLIDGLMHAEERVRQTAGLELQKATQTYYGFEASAGKREREQAQTRYRNWWLIEGKRAFGV